MSTRLHCLSGIPYRTLVKVIFLKWWGRWPGGADVLFFRLNTAIICLTMANVFVMCLFTFCILFVLTTHTEMARLSWPVYGYILRCTMVNLIYGINIHHFWIQDTLNNSLPTKSCILPVFCWLHNSGHVYLAFTVCHFCCQIEFHRHLKHCYVTPCIDWNVHTALVNRLCILLVTCFRLVWQY